MSFFAAVGSIAGSLITIAKELQAINVTLSGIAADVHQYVQASSADVVTGIAVVPGELKTH